MIFKTTILYYQAILNTTYLSKFFLSFFSRAYHVFGEAQRVYQFRDICEKGEYQNQLEDLGKLMNESHFSCRDLYNCSSPELEVLTELCRKSGAFGSRLTGAGWGGCCISLVPFEKVGPFLKAIEAVIIINYCVVLHTRKKKWMGSN